MKQLLLLTLFLSSVMVFAQQVPNFTLANAVDGKSVSLNDFKAQPGVVIIFVSNSCPYDEYYLNRIKKIAGDYSNKLPVILVNSTPNETAETMQKKAEGSGITIPYLSDSDQAVMKSLGATKNPEAFLLKNSGGKFTIAYHGAIDDNAQVEADVHQHYLRNAIDSMLAGKAIPNKEVRPVGCTIRKKS